MELEMASYADWIRIERRLVHIIEFYDILLKFFDNVIELSGRDKSRLLHIVARVQSY